MATLSPVAVAAVVAFLYLSYETLLNGSWWYFWGSLIGLAISSLIITAGLGAICREVSPNYPYGLLPVLSTFQDNTDRALTIVDAVVEALVGPTNRPAPLWKEGELLLAIELWLQKKVLDLEGKVCHPILS